MAEEHAESSLVSKGACEDCGSSDACALYDDGHRHCFSCGKHFPGDGSAVAVSHSDDSLSEDLIRHVQPLELTKRRILAETCRRYGYGIATHGGRKVQVAPYYNALGELVGQKVRTADKDFFALGKLKSALLFGQQLFRTGGKWVVVTEGEIDCLSVAQALGNKWPAVSVPSGAAGAAKAIKAQLSWLSSYDSVILWFDNDEAGREAIAECAPLLPPGKCKIITTPGGLKDASDVLVQMGAQEVVKLVWDAPTWRPDGIVAGTDISLDDLCAEPELGWMTPHKGINELTLGIHDGELWLITAGTGIGKSTTSREWLKKSLDDGDPNGAVFLEENKATTAKALIALDNNVPLPTLRTNPETLTKEQWAASYNKLIANGRYFAYDHFGSVDADNLIGRLEYLAVACGVRRIWLDHISIAVSGLDMDEGERRAIDKLMTQLRSLCERTGVAIIAVSHLRKVQNGRGFENGGEITLDDLRGSGALKQLSDTVISLERDTQAEDGESDISKVRVLKCRFSGRTGLAGRMRFDIKTGRQQELDEFDDGTFAADDY